MLFRYMLASVQAGVLLLSLLLSCCMTLAEGQQVPPPCPNKTLSVIVPVYMYPDGDWKNIIRYASAVNTLAIINPNSGPSLSSSDLRLFNSNMRKFTAANITMVGYVRTGYGARALSDILSDIDSYAANYNNIVGIFFDETASSTDQLPFYTTLYTYTISNPLYRYVILNPGEACDLAYFNISTHIVWFEQPYSLFANYPLPNNATNATSCAYIDRLITIPYATSVQDMQTAVNTTLGYYDWIYLTDRTAQEDTYAQLPQYYTSFAQTVCEANNGGDSCYPPPNAASTLTPLFALLMLPLLWVAW